MTALIRSLTYNEQQTLVVCIIAAVIVALVTYTRREPKE